MIAVDSGNMPFRINEEKTIIDCPSCKWLNGSGEEMDYVKKPIVDLENYKKIQEGWIVYSIS
jgi:hypothetical protein